MAPSVKRLTLDFGSGHDLTVRGTEPHIRLCSDSKEPAWGSLSLSLSLSLSPSTPSRLLCTRARALSLKKQKQNHTKKLYNKR